MLRVHEEVDRVVFESSLVRIGAFRCHPEHPSFQAKGPAQNYCFVFPRTAVQGEAAKSTSIQHDPRVSQVVNSGDTFLLRSYFLSNCDVTLQKQVE
jgi:hypothetical protein